MVYDFQARYRLPTGYCDREINELLAAEGDFTPIEDWSARLQLLTQALVTPSKTYAQSSDHRNRSTGLRQSIQSKTLDAYFAQQRMNYLEPLGLWATEIPELDTLPAYSFALQFTFALHKPWISQDDVDWYVIDNPVRKEKLFGLPMVAPTSWKGALRTAVVRKLAEQASELSIEEFARRRFQLTRLFGDEKGEDPGDVKAMAKFLDEAKDGAGEVYRCLTKEYFDLELDVDMPHHSGRLRFYPTFFTHISLEVINPHYRDTGVGKQPIYLECVPGDAEAEGSFTLLYIPFDLIGEEETDIKKQIVSDLRILGKGINAMLTMYGFGAKTSSGFGLAKDNLVKSGQLILKVAGLPLEEPEEPRPAKTRSKRRLRRYWKAEDQLKDEFLTSQDKFVSDAAYIESLGQEYTRSDQQLYEKAQSWWNREGKDLVEQRAEESEPETEAVEQPWAERRFKSLSKLVEKMDSLAEDLLAEERK